MVVACIFNPENTICKDRAGGVNFMSENSECALADRECVPCRGNIPPLKGDLLRQYQNQLADDWKVIDEQRLERNYRFKNFREALDFTVLVGELAERVGHHPDIYLAWGQVKVTVWTHKIQGLSEADFIFAAKTDRLERPQSENKGRPS
jgi:4a-hydroxytetrahydrobiopterin dehydratase